MYDRFGSKIIPKKLYIYLKGFYNKEILKIFNGFSTVEI
jgi:hypothetical protein